MRGYHADRLATNALPQRLFSANQRRSERRGRDSNPRTCCHVVGFQDRCNRPLCHPSGSPHPRSRPPLTQVAWRKLRQDEGPPVVAAGPEWQVAVLSRRSLRQVDVQILARLHLTAETRRGRIGVLVRYREPGSWRRLGRLGFELRARVVRVSLAPLAAVGGGRRSAAASSSLAPLAVPLFAPVLADRVVADEPLGLSWPWGASRRGDRGLPFNHPGYRPGGPPSCYSPSPQYLSADK